MGSSTSHALKMASGGPAHTPPEEDGMLRLYRGEADRILCWKLDRLARNAADSGAI